MCANTLMVPKLAVAALVLLVAARTFQMCAAHPRLLVPTGTADDEGGKLDAEAGGVGGTEHDHGAGETRHHPDYTVAIARNPYNTARAGVQLPPQGGPSFAEDDLQLDREQIREGDRTKRHAEQQGVATDGDAKDGSSAWEEPLAEASEPDAEVTDTSSSQSEDDAAAEAISSVIYGQRIVPRIEPPAQEQHFFPSFASLFSPPPPPSSILGYNHDSSINRPRHPSGQLGGGERNHYAHHHHHHHSPYSGFDGYGEEEDDSFGLFQGSEHGTHNPRTPPPVLQPPRTKPSYQAARQLSASVNTDAKHSGILGSGNFAVMRGGTYYDEKDKSASEHRGNYYGDPFGNGHGGPSYNSGNYHRGLPSNPRPRPGRDHFADFRDFADITAPKPAFSQLVVVYAANQNGSGVEEGRNGSGQNTPPRNIIERLKLLDGEEGDKEETESQRNSQGMGDDMVLWDGEGGREDEDEEDEVMGDEREEEEEEEENIPPGLKIIPRPNNINEKLKLLDAEPDQTTEEVPKKEKMLSLGKRKLALMREKGKWVSDKAKRVSKEDEPLLALS